MKTIPESDRKKLRSLKTVALNLACGRILASAAHIVEKRDGPVQ